MRLFIFVLFDLINLFVLYRLIFGGYWLIKIASIRLIEDDKKFERIIGALYYLDMAISGMDMYGSK